MSTPYGRTWERGVQLNWRTVEMLEVAELQWLEALTPLRLVQGSYNAGGVSASGGTHDGGGALDVGIKEWTDAQRQRIVWALRSIGFAAWLRTPSQGNWGYHIHAIAVGDRQMSSAAAWQVSEYKAGRNGLANQRPDDGPRVAWTVYRQDIDLSYRGPEHWNDADFAALERRLGLARIKAYLDAKNSDILHEANTAPTRLLAEPVGGEKEPDGVTPVSVESAIQRIYNWTKP